jgi:hypothetical protein
MVTTDYAKNYQALAKKTKLKARTRAKTKKAAKPLFCFLVILFILAYSI